MADPTTPADDAGPYQPDALRLRALAMGVAHKSDAEAIKAAPAAHITDRIRAMGIKQSEVAALVEADPPKVSAIVRGDLGQFWGCSG